MAESGWGENTSKRCDPCAPADLAAKSEELKPVPEPDPEVGPVARLLAYFDPSTPWRRRPYLTHHDQEVVAAWVDQHPCERCWPFPHHEALHALGHVHLAVQRPAALPPITQHTPVERKPHKRAKPTAEQAAKHYGRSAPGRPQRGS